MKSYHNHRCRHGRDSKLQVWKLAGDDEQKLSKSLPADASSSTHPAPWILHSLDVNTLNFCAFASCLDKPRPDAGDTPPPILLAVPGATDGTIVIYSLPNEDIISRITTGPHQKTGLLMALSLSRPVDALLLTAGFETGSTITWRQNPSTKTWHELRRTQLHTQPVLSIALSPDHQSFFTSGADSVIARHFLDGSPPRVVQTQHSGQQGLAVRSDGRIIATAGWDGRGRVYSAKTLEELAVLKWHKEGCYATAFATIEEGVGDASDALVQSSSSTATLTVAQRRARRARGTHWVALGSKDGKVSLWDIF